MVCEGGEAREVAVAREDDGVWCARFAAEPSWPNGFGFNARTALLRACAIAAVDVVEIVAPGAQTSEERMAAVTAERDKALELAARRGRLIDGAVTVDDAMRAFAFALVEASPDAPNCIEWPVEIDGRNAVVAIQWQDGKSPQTLLAEALADRDTAHASHAALAEVVRAYLAAADAHESEATRWQREYIRSHTEHAAVIVAARDAALAKRTALDALLDGAPAGYVRTEVVGQ